MPLPEEYSAAACYQDPLLRGPGCWNLRQGPIRLLEVRGEGADRVDRGEYAVMIPDAHKNVTP